jgi:hypothetical protein
MSKTTKEFMRKVRCKLTRLSDLECRACGHEEGVQKALQCRFDLEEMIEDHIREMECVASMSSRSGVNL